LTAIAFKYGLLEPIDWDDDCDDHLYRMNNLWNTLVEIEGKHNEKYRALIAGDDTVAPVQARVDALLAERRELQNDRRDRRKAARARGETAGLDARMRELSEELRSAVSALKAARSSANARVRESVRQVNTARFEAVKLACQASRLWWGNCNAVWKAYETARSRTMTEGGQLRFRKFTGEGRFRVQIPHGASVEELIAGVKQVWLDMNPQPVPGRQGRARPRLSMTIYTDEKRKPRLLTWPIVYDRSLPGDCRIQEVVVSRRRIGTKWRYAGVFNCRLGDQPAVKSSNERVCGINLGFRQTTAGLRIATSFSGQRILEHSLSQKWMRGMDNVESIQRRRDLALNDVTAALREHWASRPAMPEHLREQLSQLVCAPQFGAARLARLVLHWRTQCPEVWPALLERLEKWRRDDKRALEVQANLREHLAHARREHYRLLARTIARVHGTVRIGAIDLRGIAKLDRGGGAENELHQRARRNRVRASLHLFQQELSLQAQKFCTRIEYVTGPVSITCHACGGTCVLSTDVMHACEHCCAVWDQDENAARNIFATSRD
jgi:Putative transposase DNA-binding domain